MTPSTLHHCHDVQRPGCCAVCAPYIRQEKVYLFRFFCIYSFDCCKGAFDCIGYVRDSRDGDRFSSQLLRFIFRRGRGSGNLGSSGRACRSHWCFFSASPVVSLGRACYVHPCFPRVLRPEAEHQRLRDGRKVRAQCPPSVMVYAHVIEVFLLPVDCVLCRSRECGR